MLRGTLFTEDFLTEGILDYPEWPDVKETDIADFRTALTNIFKKFPVTGTNIIEATTESDLIEPVLSVLGWDHHLTQQTTARKGREDVPDYLLFEDEVAKDRANSEREQWQRYRHGLAILEAKAWNVQLDRKGNQPLDRVPSNQIIRYLTSVDTQSNGHIQWGILTNGRLWRIYYNRAKSKSEDYLEIDLPVALGIKGFQPDLFASSAPVAQDWLKVFYVLFRREAFMRQRENKSFHERALDRGKYWEDKVTNSLSKIVFEDVFPALLAAIKDHDPEKPDAIDDAYLAELRDNSLTLLYRFLFILYAEDRNLLPVYDSKYDDYGMRKRIRENIVARIEEKDTFSTTRDGYYHHAKGLFASIDKGDESIGLPPYNGGLFNTNAFEMLNRVRIPDAVLAPIIYKLSHRDDDGVMKWINYRDLSVQQLGSIYERLLEFYPKIEEDGTLNVRPNIFARKTSGSYYTPEPLVRLILEKAVGPLLQERKDYFFKKMADFKALKNKKEKNKLLESADPAAAMLELRICDPAMGSGHFLVSLVDYLADNILETIDEVEAEGAVTWADADHPYISPVTARIQAIRAKIMEQAELHGWNVKEEQLDDKQVVRRMILKRCVFGVDKNPMAVELAKVSLWLHTFTVGAPLSFLDHHLRCGDSLFGEWVGGVQDELRERGGLLSNDTVAKAKQSAAGMEMIERITDADIAEVKTSADTFNGVAEATGPLNAFLSLYHALRWVSEAGSRQETNLNKAVIDSWLSGAFGDAIKIAEDKAQVWANTEQANRFKDLLTRARTLIEDEKFLNWQVAFPGVWTNWDTREPEGGFDAVIGNPPWDRFEFDETEWFANQSKEIAFHTGNKRKQLIIELKKARDPLWDQYLVAYERSVAASILVKKGMYSELSEGKLNIYKLFTELAHRLISKNGIVGFVMPSGISADQSSSKFFKKISTSGRLGGLFDFENGPTRRAFFPDVDSRFKFCIYIAGGIQRKFEQTQVAFFLHSVEELNEEGRIFKLTYEDFARTNPNTGTVPIFRSQHDAQITRHFFEKFPIIYNHNKSKPWPIKYMQGMFNMTSDSGEFRSKTSLEKEGFYPIENNRFKKADQIYVPLYEGKMVQMYDHRAASVIINESNLNRPAQPEATSALQYANPKYLPTPQYFVNETSLPLKFDYYLGFKDITSPTNQRTMISMVIPKSAVGNKIPLLVPDGNISTKYINLIYLLIANLNSYPFDYVTRQKIHGQTLNWFIVEQLPVIPPTTFQQKLGNTTIADFIKEHVLHLTYTAYDMQPFARDMGYEGEPFMWDEEDRRHRRAKLDALFFNLYGIDEHDADYILSTFPIVRRQDEAAHGRFLTRDLILGYMRALKAGDTEVKIAA